MKSQYQVEFSIFGKRMKTKVYAETAQKAQELVLVEVAKKVQFHKIEDTGGYSLTDEESKKIDDFFGMFWK